MGMTTSHHAREWFIAAALRVCHEYRTTAQYKPKERVVELLKNTLEIDVHAKLAQFFATTSNIFAQGRSDIDIKVQSPSLASEVKFLIDKRNSCKDVLWDWNELIKINNTNNKFSQRAWVVFFPPTDWFSFSDCQAVTKPKQQKYNWSEIAAFLPFAEPFMPPHGQKEKLRWRPAPARLTVIWMPNGRKARVDVVGDKDDALWAAVYTRITPDEYNAIKDFTKIDVKKQTISPVSRQYVKQL